MVRVTGVIPAANVLPRKPSVKTRSCAFPEHPGMTPDHHIENAYFDMNRGRH